MISPQFKGYVNSLESKRVPVIRLEKAKFLLTAAEMQRDFEHFCYIMDNAYSGKEYWENNGILFSEKYNQIHNRFSAYEKLGIGQFMAILVDAFQDIHDGHLCFSSTQTGRHSFKKTYSAYFSDVLVEKQGNTCVVIKSNHLQISPGQIISGPEIESMLFPTLSPIGRRYCLLGVRSWEPVKSIEVCIDNEPQLLPLHKCRQTGDNDNGIYRSAQIGDHQVIYSSRFWEEGNEKKDEILKGIRSLGERLRETDHVIWDIHDNGGGNSRYPEEFLLGLNSNAVWPVNVAILSSPAIDQAREKASDLAEDRKWTLYDAEERDYDKSTYKGTLYILVGEKVASSGEAAVSQAMNVKDCVFIGSNTSGTGIFGDTLSFVLPSSAIRLTVPYKLFLGGAEEGEGFAPTYWLDTDDVLGETIRWLENRDDYMAL